jgi:hypothetical protein
MCIYELFYLYTTLDNLIFRNMIRFVQHMEKIPTGEKAMETETVFCCSVDVSERSLRDMAELLKMTWVHPRVSEVFYPFKDSFSGKWAVEVLQPRKKEKFEDLVRLARKDGWQPATIYHLMTLLASQEGEDLSGSFMALASLCVDDFECPGCVVLSIQDEDRKIGLGNWRGSKIGGYNIVRVKKINDDVVEVG